MGDDLVPYNSGFGHLPAQVGSLPFWTAKLSSHGRRRAAEPDPGCKAPPETHHQDYSAKPGRKKCKDLSADDGNLCAANQRLHQGPVRTNAGARPGLALPTGPRLQAQRVALDPGTDSQYREALKRHGMEGLEIAADGAPCQMPYNSSKVILMVSYSSVCMLALPANCVTAWLTLLQALQGNVLSIYLFCLALCELLYASTLPLWIVYIRDNHRWGLGDWACKVTAYIFFCNIYVSILFLCCISCDRYMAVVYPLQSRTRRHRKVAILVSAAVFVVVGGIYWPVFKVTTNTTCFEPVLVDQRTATYYYSRFTCGFVVPVSVIAYTNWRVFKSIKQCVSLSAAQKARIKRLLMAVVAIFLVCFAPYHLVLLIRAAAFSHHKGNTTSLCPLERDFFYTPSVVFLCLCTVNSVVDPIIYLLARDPWLWEGRRHLCWSHWHSRTGSIWFAASKDSEEPQLPALPMNSGTFSTAVHPPGAQQGTGASVTP